MAPHDEVLGYGDTDWIGLDGTRGRGEWGQFASDSTYKHSQDLETPTTCSHFVKSPYESPWL
jgi:hypothetical protein